MSEVHVFNAHPRYRVPKRPVELAVRRVLAHEGRSRAEIAVVLIDTRYCIRINTQFLGHRYSTDVISFPLNEGANLEGEIYVNLDKAREQAATYGVTFTNELTRLVVHGTLHLVGYDDQKRANATRMKEQEDAHVAKLMGGKKSKQ